MKKEYKSLLLTDEWNIIKKGGRTGRHIVPCLPVVFSADRFFPEDDEKRPDIYRSEFDNASKVIDGFPYVLENAAEVEKDYLDMIDARLSGYPLEILRTDRCIVREISAEDVPELYEIYKDPEITRYMEDLYEDMDEEIKYTKDYIKWHYGLYGYGMWIVTDKEGRITGRAGFDQKEEKEPHLGFMIRKDMQGQGLAYEVCSALMEYAASHIKAPGIISLTHPQNEKSAALLKKLGFTQRGRQDSMTRWYRPL